MMSNLKTQNDLGFWWVLVSRSGDRGCEEDYLLVRRLRQLKKQQRRRQQEGVVMRRRRRLENSSSGGGRFVSMCVS
jgi:hypothetical protein